MKKALFIIFFCCVQLVNSSAKAADAYYYQLKVYHLKTTRQATRLDAFLKDAYLPALHRAGVKMAGVFKPVVKDTTDQLVYVFIPFKKFDQFLALSGRLEKDTRYLADGKDYLEAINTDPVYTRMESILLRAFSGMPEPMAPKLTSPKSERVYELRSYESATEAITANKIGMFNQDEITIFTNLNFNAVFYGQVVSGPRMPNLMYLTTFNNKADRDKHWADFGPEYKKISGLPKYSNTATKNTIIFLTPTDYSDI
ncbi:NIPSNAP family protein [Hufsiella ginkgonis]|uniref:NIPSNAP family containing protein n=1 Tax=Hufsiella ginkgonis TaxID=2695274 RepID=A0A7K1XW95_9SPHI|nr:NIPSNAP family protein [Hufsiella ginkgonis]MXV15273.1 NIPSNAP family containing protein [Hufsiella ginkgonis]